MKNSTLIKISLLALLFVMSMVQFWPPKDKVTLGLDLQGGTSFTVEINEDEVKSDIEANAVLFTEEEKMDMSEEQMTAQREARIKKLVQEKITDSKESVLEVIRNRVDGLGIAEPVIFSSEVNGSERITVQLPGVNKEKREAARKSIESAAVLEFRLVHENSDQWVKELLAAGEFPKGFKINEAQDALVRDEIALPEDNLDSNYWREFRKFKVKSGCELLLQSENRSGREYRVPVYVETRTRLFGKAVEQAMPTRDPMTGAVEISLRFNSDGATEFANVTSEFAPKGEKYRRLAIVLDNTLYSSPRINEKILGGSASISGNFDIAEASTLSNVLRSGSLDVPVRIIQTMSVGPTLGKESVTSGLTAALIAFLAVLVFMLIYYRKAGLVADLALFLDMLLLPMALWVAAGFLGIFSGNQSIGASASGLPTLTLPGIAGIILTMGMAVDANVLIFERIREELRNGKNLMSAVSAGYEKAFSTIFDANLTTVITAVILFIFGSGAIRGFAVTLTGGILVSMLVVLVYTRMFFETMISRTKMKSLEMMSVIKDTTIDFLSKRNMALALSGILIVITWGAFFVQGPQKNMGVDFVGGSSFIVRYTEAGLEAPAIQKKLNDALTGTGAQVQHQQGSSNSEVGSFFDIRVSEEGSDATREVLTKQLVEHQLIIEQEDEVRGQIGQEMRNKGILSIFWALLGIIIYVTLRFEFSFAVGAIAALVHDVLMTVGIYCLLGNELSLPVVAAVLTIVGYSVNDTIVVFDRIREDLKLIQGKTFAEIANLSINQTLSRTLLTSVTTLLSVAVLLIFGGSAIRDFTMTLFIGVIVGTYSSIFVATPVVQMIKGSSAKKKA